MAVDFVFCTIVAWLFSIAADLATTTGYTAPDFEVGRDLMMGC